MSEITKRLRDQRKGFWDSIIESGTKYIEERLIEYQKDNECVDSKLELKVYAKKSLRGKDTEVNLTINGTDVKPEFALQYFKRDEAVIKYVAGLRKSFEKEEDIEVKRFTPKFSSNMVDENKGIDLLVLEINLYEKIDYDNKK